MPVISPIFSFSESVFALSIVLVVLGGGQVDIPAGLFGVILDDTRAILEEGNLIRLPRTPCVRYGRASKLWLVKLATATASLWSM